MSKLSWGIWAVRTAIAWVGGAAIAWGVSFWVADYVVKAHTTGTDTAINTINSTLSTINATLGRLEGRMDKMDAVLVGHTAALAAQTADLDTIKATTSGSEGAPALALPGWLNPEAFAQIAMDAGRARAIAEQVSTQVGSLADRVTLVEVSLRTVISLLNARKQPD